MANRLRRRTFLRIRAFVVFTVVYGGIGFCWEIIESGDITMWGFGTGLVIGITLAMLENTRVISITDPLPFSIAVVVKSLIYLAVIAIPWMIVGYIGGLAQGFEMEEFFDWLLSTEFLGQIGLVYLIHLVVVFFLQLNRLLGPGTLVRYLSGMYHHPRVERRVFMFIDVKSSTSLAETLGAAAYFSLLNTFFRDISEPILDRGAEIYQYVGDEVVLSWPVEVGLRDANCVRVFIEMLAEIHSKRDHYLAEYGHVPEFKAGLHFGDVITAEIGDLKKEIVYNGDVLDTTARIQSKCNEMDQLLIASEKLVAALDLPNFITPRNLGAVELRGKAEAVQLIGLA